MCTYRLLLPSLLLRLSAFIIVHCFPAEVRSFSRYKFTPGLSELDLLHFVVFVALKRAYAITCLALGEKHFRYNTASAHTRVTFLRVCTFTLNLATSLSLTDRQ